MRKSIASRWIILGVLTTSGLVAGTSACLAEDFKSSAEILEALSPDEDGTREIGPATGDGGRGVGVIGKPSVALDIPFELNSDRLQPAASAQLDALAQALASDGLLSARVEIIGHTDSTGSAPYNLRLSLKRAESARRYLIDHHGIDPARLVPVGRGEQEPLADIDPAAGENRRVEVRVIKPD